MIFTLYNIDYILKIVYYHVYNHSKQFELLIQFMFSCNRDFHSACWGEFVQKNNSTLFNRIDGTGVATNIKTQIQFNTPSCMSKLHQTMQTRTLSSTLTEWWKWKECICLQSLHDVNNQPKPQSRRGWAVAQRPHAKLSRILFWSGLRDQVTAKCHQWRSCSNKEQEQKWWDLSKIWQGSNHWWWCQCQWWAECKWGMMRVESVAYCCVSSISEVHMCCEVVKECWILCSIFFVWCNTTIVIFMFYLYACIHVQ